MASRQRRLVQYLEHSVQLTNAQKRVLAEWKRATERLTAHAEKLFSRCISIRTVPLLILDHVLQYMEGDQSHMEFNEFINHAVSHARVHLAVSC
jgi:hypothetical protein